MSSTETRKAYENYYKDPEMVKADFNWEQHGTNEIYTHQHGEKTFAPGTIKGSPAFEPGALESIGLPTFNIWRLNGGTMIAKTENWTVIIPGGFRDAPTPNKMNPISFDIGKYSALMGLLHVIAIPNQRITNCVTVTADNIPLIKEGISLLETAFYRVLADGGSNEIGSVRWQLSQSGDIKMKDGTKKSVKVTENDFVDECKGNFRDLIADPQGSIDKMKMSVTCHADTMSSIRKFHLHGFSEDFRTVAWQKMEEKASESGLNKNTPIEEVINMAMSGEVSRLKDSVLKGPELPVPDEDFGLSRQSTVSPIPPREDWGDDKTVLRRLV